MSLVYAGMPCTVLLTLPVGAILYYNGSLDLNTWVSALMLDLSMSGPLTRVINFFPMFPQVDYTVKQLEALYSAEDVHSGVSPSGRKAMMWNLKMLHLHIRTGTFLKMRALKRSRGSRQLLLVNRAAENLQQQDWLFITWDVSDGSITIGGRDIREYTFDTLMSMTAYVAQDNFLFRGTIADNLRMGKKTQPWLK